MRSLTKPFLTLLLVAFLLFLTGGITSAYTSNENIYDYEITDTPSYYPTSGDFYDNSTTSGAEELFSLIFAGTFLVVYLFLIIGTYVFGAITLSMVAKQTGFKDIAWYAWIPVLNILLLFKMGDQNPWLILLMLVPIIGAFAIGILSIIATMNVCEKRGYDKLFGLFVLVPLGYFILWGLLAWGKKTKETSK